MKILFGFLLLLPSLVMASFPVVDIKELNGKFFDGRGEAYAQSASYQLPQIKVNHSEINFLFDKLANKLTINDPSTTVELKLQLSLANTFKSFIFDGVTIESTTDDFHLNTQSIDLFIDQKKYLVSDFNFFTNVSANVSKDNANFSLIDGLIFKSGLQLKKLKFGSVDSNTIEDFTLENNILKESLALPLALPPMIIRKMRISVNEGIFSGVGTVDSYINLALRLGGKISTNKDKTHIEILLVRAKLGYFSVRSTLMGMLKRLNLDGVKVEGNKIIVALIDESSSSLKISNKI